MRKDFKRYALIWAIIFVVFQVICFAVPHAEGASRFLGGFGVGYLFITIGFLGQLACAYYAFKADSLQKLFYHIPLISVSYGGLMAMLAVGGLTMAIPGFPVWLGAIVCLLVLAFSAIAVIKASAAADIVQSVDQKVTGKTLFIRALTTDAESLTAQAQSVEMKALCRQVWEAVRYSDPMSDDALGAIEAQITVKFSAFSDAVTADDMKAGNAAARELLILIGERNKKCKLLK